MGVTYNEVVENSLLSQEVIDCIPSECECGAPIEFTNSLRQIYCSNPRCWYKVAARLESMCKAMKSDGWGESTCVTVCKEFGIVSPYQVFLLEEKVKQGLTSSVSAFEKKVANVCDMTKRRVKLWEVVKLAGLPSIETTAYKIFDGYNSLTEAYNDIETGQVPFIAEKLGIKNSEGSVMAVNIYKTLIEYKQEILFGETQFDIYKTEGETIYVAITGGVEGYRNKSEYINYINNRYIGKVNAMLMNSVTSQVDILISDGDTSSNKFKTAIKINDKYQSEGIKNNLFRAEDVGKFKNKGDLHPIGEKIFVTDSTNAIYRLDDMLL